jgi:parallel beta-helix repeat protein
VNPNTIDVRAKQRRYAFDLRGKSGVTIQNIGIFACSIVTDSQSTNNTLDRIDAQYVSHFTSLPTASNDPSGSQFSILGVHESDSGIVINGSGNTLQDSSISYSAGSGIVLEGSNNTVRNNLVQDVDYIGDNASGIVIDGNGDAVQNNTVDTVGRFAVLVNAAVDEDISYNNLFSSMMLSRDGAELYACCNQVASGTRFHHNWIHDTTDTTNGMGGDSYSLSGITIDNGSIGFVVDQNVVWHNQVDNILITGIGNTGPNTNYVHNNTIPDDSAIGVIRLLYVADCTATRVVDNRVALDVRTAADGPGCALSNNNSSAPGATEMTLTTQIGCNFDGCSSYPPPGFSEGNSVTPCPVTSAGILGTAVADNRQMTVNGRAQSGLNCRQ